MTRPEPPEDRLAEVFDGLRADPAPAFTGPGAGAARRAAARRRRTRVLAVTAAVVAVGVGVGVTALQKPDRLEPLPPATPSATSTPSPTPRPTTASPASTPSGPRSPSATPSRSSSPTPSATRVTSLRRTDWRNAILDLPDDDACPADRVRFRNGTASVRDERYGGFDMVYVMLPARRAPEPVYGDLDGDGRDEAVVVIECHGGPAGGPPESSYVVAAYTENEIGGPEPLGIVATEEAYAEFSLVSAAGGVVTATWKGTDPDDPVERRRYRWNGSRFVRTA